MTTATKQAQRTPGPSDDVQWLHKFINCVPFGADAPASDIQRAHAIIVRACNSHDDLLTALELCERALSHNSLDAMNESALAKARMACRVALGRHEAVEAARAAIKASS